MKSMSFRHPHRKRRGMPTTARNVFVRVTLAAAPDSRAHAFDVRSYTHIPYPLYIHISCVVLYIMCNTRTCIRYPRGCLWGCLVLPLLQSKKGELAHTRFGAGFCACVWCTLMWCTCVSLRFEPFSHVAAVLLRLRPARGTTYYYYYSRAQSALIVRVAFIVTTFRTVLRSGHIVNENIGKT